MKIAVIDPINQDIGLNILFPNADYYHMITELDKSASYQRHTITPLENLNEITDAKYDTLFVLFSLYDCFKTYNNEPNRFYKEHYDVLLDRVIDIINKNDFKHIAMFDNYDYDYDPNILYEYKLISKPMTFFKRNYNKTKEYKDNVVAFPFIMFGQNSLIHFTGEAVRRICEEPAPLLNTINTVFFSGNLFTHIDPVYDCFRCRKTALYNILNSPRYAGEIEHKHNMPHDVYMREMAKHRFALDLNGVGDPNRRTFEIFAAGSLRIAQRNDLEWTFDEADDFCEETYFTNENDFFDKIQRLRTDTALYNKCIERQNQLITNYMNPDRLRTYIIAHIEYHKQ